MSKDAPLPVLLIVDDEPINIGMLNEILQSDYQVLFATNGYDALQITAEQRPDLVLLDVMMPGLSGHEVCIRLKSDPDLQGIPVIFVTAKGGERDEMVGLEAGAVDYITKPINPAVVRLRVKNYLELKKHRDQLQDLVKARTAELQQACEISKERESLLWTILVSSLDAFVMMDVQGKIVEFNPAAERLFGYGRDQAIGRKVEALIISPEWQERHCQVLAGLVEQPSTAQLPTIRRMYVDGLRTDGKVLDLEMTVATIMAHGQPLHTAFLRDITSIKQFRASLEAALEAAEVASHAKDLFLDNMGHEIRTPMNAIIGLSYLAIQSNPSEKVLDYLRNIELASHALLSIIDNILDFSRATTNNIKLNSVTFYLSDLLDRLGNLFGEQTADKGIELLFFISPECNKLLCGDALRMEQVLVNLIRNAVKFTDTGSIVVTVRAVKIRTEVLQLYFSVRDTGIGIASDKMGILFESFVQADGSSTRRYGGIGLGLALCKQLVNLLGGKIWIESTLGVGSTFHFDVTISYQEEESSYLNIPVHMQGMKVLVVDDNLLAREVMAKMLRNFTFSVTLADSGASAMEKLMQSGVTGQPYSLFVVDWRMPEMDGIETIDQIHKQLLASGHDIKCPGVLRPKMIMLTAFGRQAVQQHALAVGADLFLNKPVSSAKLWNALITLFGANAHQQANTVGLANGQETCTTMGDARISLEENPLLSNSVKTSPVCIDVVDRVLVKSLLTELSILLREHSLETDMVLAALRSQLHASHIAKVYQELVREVNNYNFVAAGDLVMEIARVLEISLGGRLNGTV